MLHQAAQLNQDSELNEMVEELLREDRQLTILERRSYHRQPFVRPVTIFPTRGMQVPVVGFSKNISPSGIGLLCMKGTPERLVARIEIHRTAGKPLAVLSECRWCDDFGDGWYISGWNFLSPVRTSE